MRSALGSCGRFLPVVASLAVAGPALAQPGATPPPAGAPPPAWVLEPGDDALLRRGEIPPGAIVVGGAVGTVVGFGLGHAIEGRFRERGWIFALGESIAAGVLMVEFVRCIPDEDWSIEGCSGGWLAAGAVGFGGLRLWEIVDVWVGPPRHNARVRAARERASGRARRSPAIGVAPAGSGGAVVGLTLEL